MYKGNADWTLIKAVKDNPRMNIPVFGNGDVDSPAKAKLMRDDFGLDGAMIGRASIGNPWVFNEIKHFLKTGNYLDKPNMTERVEACKQHLKHSIEWRETFWELQR